MYDPVRIMKMKYQTVAISQSNSVIVKLGCFEHDNNMNFKTDGVLYNRAVFDARSDDEIIRFSIKPNCRECTVKLLGSCGGDIEDKSTHRDKAAAKVRTFCLHSISRNSIKPYLKIHFRLRREPKISRRSKKVLKQTLYQRKLS